jgi:hypothetical protein
MKKGKKGSDPIFSLIKNIGEKWGLTPFSLLVVALLVAGEFFVT